MVNKPLIRPYFWGGYVRGGGWLTSHKETHHFFVCMQPATKSFLSSETILLFFWPATRKSTRFGVILPWSGQMTCKLPTNKNEETLKPPKKSKTSWNAMTHFVVRNLQQNSKRSFRECFFWNKLKHVLLQIADIKSTIFFWGKNSTQT